MFRQRKHLTQDGNQQTEAQPGGGRGAPLWREKAGLGAEQEGPGTSLRPKPKFRCHSASCPPPSRPFSVAAKVKLKHQLGCVVTPLLKTLDDC